MPSGVRFVLENATLKNGAPAPGQSGGAIASAGTTILRNVAVVKSSVSGPGASGGALFNDGGTLKMNGSKLVRNDAVRAGGAVEANAGTTIMGNVNLANNSAGTEPGNGGALHLTGTGPVGVDSSRVANNTAALEGGGLWNSDTGVMAVSNTDLGNNAASGPAATEGGGGAYNDGGELNVVRSLLSGNTADGAAGSGGAILNDLGALSGENSKLSDNAASRAGGAIEANLGTTTVTDSMMDDNNAGAAPGNGGALHLTGAGEVTVAGGSVVGNRAALEGGGLWNSASGTMTVRRALMEKNIAVGGNADEGGGGIYNDGGALGVRGTSSRPTSPVVCPGRAAPSSRSPVRSRSSTAPSPATRSARRRRHRGGRGDLLVRQSTFDGNTAGPNPGNGGAVHVTGAATTVWPPAPSRQRRRA